MRDSEDFAGEFPRPLRNILFPAVVGFCVQHLYAKCIERTFKMSRQSREERAGAGVLSSRPAIVEDDRKGRLGSSHIYTSREDNILLELLGSFLAQFLQRYSACDPIPCRCEYHILIASRQP